MKTLIAGQNGKTEEWLRRASSNTWPDNVATRPGDVKLRERQE